MRKLFYKTTALIFILISAMLMAFYFLSPKAHHELISLFPIENYDQTISNWIKPSDRDYDRPLLTNAQQTLRIDEWYDHQYGAHSPWDADYVRQIYATISPNDLKSGEQEKINFYSNKDKLDREIGYGSNFRPYSDGWIANLQGKMNLKQFDVKHYSPSKRSIAINNIHARQLPTDEVHFYNQKFAGEGYPFDNLQASVIWAGTPLYVLGETVGQDWSLVLSPSFIAWVKTTEIAFVDDQFIKAWSQQAKKNLVAITQINVPIKDIENNLYRFSGYIGMVFPGSIKNSTFDLWVPVSDEAHQAHIHHADVPKQQATFMPLLPTPHHFVDLISQLIGRPYGWGGMYFYSDCALELKDLYTPFGTWLPIHSSDQANEQQYHIKTIDLSNQTVDDRLDYLAQHGHPFMTIVYIGGHVFMYVKGYPDPNGPDHKLIALSYQTIWGLKPKPTFFNKDRRAVIGKAVLFPVLKQYPEDRALASLAERKDFKIVYLDVSPKDFAPRPQKIELNSLLSP